MIAIVVFIFEFLTVAVLGLFAAVVFSERDRFHEPPTALNRDPIGRQFVLAAKTGFWFWKLAVLGVSAFAIWEALT